MGDVDLVKSDLGPVKPWVRAAAIEIVTACPYQIYWWWGAPGRGTGDHARGLALDLMNYANGTTSNPGPERREVQNWVKGYVMQHRVRLGVDGDSAYIIADRQIASDESNPDWSWREYDGSDPHTNHVHISFKSSHTYQPPPEDDVTPEQLREAIRDELGISSWDRKYLEYYDNDGNAKRDPISVAHALFLAQQDAAIARKEVLAVKALVQQLIDKENGS